MYLTSLNRRVSLFRKHVFVWTLLAVLALFWNSSVSHAQQPTATISALSGEVVVSGTTPATVGMVLQAGDSIQTQVGASVVLVLSDGSRLELGEDTTIDIAQLIQDPTTGARVSLVKLAWGRLRAFLSSEHQKAGSSFEVGTPNAVVGVKFSEPDIEVIYDPDTNTTMVFAYTVDVVVTNLITGETKLITRGNQGIVQGNQIKTPWEPTQEKPVETDQDIEKTGNRPPKAFPDRYTLKHAKELNVPTPGVLSNDKDPDKGAQLTAELVEEPSSGTLKFNRDGSFTFTPKGDMTGAVTFTYVVKDRADVRSNPATVTISTASERIQQTKNVITKIRNMSQGAVNNQANAGNNPGTRENPAKDQPQHQPLIIIIQRAD